MRLAFCPQYSTLAFRWLTPAAFSKGVRLKVTSGTSARALLYNNLEAMLDARFMWRNSSPLTVGRQGGLTYILVESALIQNCTVISQEVTVILESLHDFASALTLRLLGLIILPANLHYSTGLFLLSVCTLMKHLTLQSAAFGRESAPSICAKKKSGSRLSKAILANAQLTRPPKSEWPVCTPPSPRLFHRIPATI